MSVGLAFNALGCTTAAVGIRTKSDALKFALESTVEYSDNGRIFRYDRALEMFNFFCEHVSLVDSDVVPITELLDGFLDKVKEYTEWAKENKDKAG